MLSPSHEIDVLGEAEDDGVVLPKLGTSFAALCLLF